MIKFFKQCFCNHNWIWKQNVYGDAINVLECRSIWVCDKCDAYAYGKELKND